MNTSSKRIRRSPIAMAACTALCFCMAAAHAEDGVVLINQDTVTRAGGFPFKITKPGSYKLSGDLVLNAPNSNAIEIRSDHVTLDLNGFGISGSFFAGVALGEGFSATGTTVRNGFIDGAEVNGIELGGTRATTVDHVKVTSTLGGGIQVGESSIVTDNIVVGAVGLQVGPRVVSPVIASKSPPIGILAAAGSTIRGNVVTDIGGIGIRALSDSTVLGNSVTNTLAGIFARCPSTIIDNTAPIDTNGNGGIGEDPRPVRNGPPDCTRADNNPFP